MPSVRESMIKSEVAAAVAPEPMVVNVKEEKKEEKKKSPKRKKTAKKATEPKPKKQKKIKKAKKTGSSRPPNRWLLHFNKWRHENPTFIKSNPNIMTWATEAKKTYVPKPPPSYKCKECGCINTIEK